MCDASGYVLGVLNKYTGAAHVRRLRARCSREVELDAVMIATPSRTHAPMVRAALERGLHVFCEKPLRSSRPTRAAGRARRGARASSPRSATTTASSALPRGQALLDAGAIGTVTHVLGEAYGPVVLKPKGGTWRSRKPRAAAPLRLRRAPDRPAQLVLGGPVGVGGTVLNLDLLARDRRRGLQHAVLRRRRERAALGQLVRRVLSQDDHPVTSGAPPGGSIADRQECQVYLRDTAPPRRATSRAGTSATRPSSPSRSASTCAARSTAPRSTTSSSGSAPADPDGANSFASAAATDR